MIRYVIVIQNAVFHVNRNTGVNVGTANDAIYTAKNNQILVRLEKLK